MTTINLIATGNNIKCLRDAAGLNTKDLQVVFGFRTPQAIFKWYRGETLPTVDNLVILAELFGVKIDDILVTDSVSSLAA